ncbi:MAG TPA: LytTR family transcriptional regulator [Acholeplasmataceae bacterium]|jgi:DNA-binding LytR/AlgR family response regulator|nr:LytTR family transcriptional regulator [Acholeplasmataceae bacterium]
MIKLALNIERAEKLIELLKSDAYIELETLVLKDDILFQVPTQHEATFFRLLNEIIDKESGFWLDTIDEKRKVYPSECLYFESLGYEVILVNSFYKDIFLKHTLAELEVILADLKFVRISKTVIVNLDKIEYIKPLLNSKLELSLPGGIKLEVNRSYLKPFRLALKEKGGF